MFSTQSAKLALALIASLTMTIAADALAQDASGDALDAVLCLVQAAWAQRAYDQGDSRYGLPVDMDALEGWILGA